MTTHRFTEAFAILAMTVLGNALVGSAATPVRVDEAIAILKGIESQIQVTEWVGHYREAILSDPSDIESVVEVKPEYQKMHVIFSPGTGKYFAEIESVSRWVDGAAPFVSQIQADSYDGDVFRHWLRSLPGRQLPTRETVAGRGYVTREMNSATGPRDFVTDYGWTSGLGFMPPFCHDFEGRPTVLSELLAERVREGILVSINEDDAGIWTIQLDDPSRYRDRLLLSVDPGRNGVIVGAEWRGGREYGLWRRLEVDVREVGGGIHVPVRLSLVAILNRPPDMIQIEFSDIMVNHSIPEDTFRLTFPTGVNIHDHIEQRSYTVGQDIDSQVEQVRRYRERYPGLTATVEAQNTRSWIFGLAVTLVAGVLIWWIWRVGRKGVASVLVLLLLHGMVGNAAELDQDGNWVISHAPGERIVVSQCGFTVASFALMHFDRDFDAKILSTALRPEGDGVSLRDLRVVLEAYGLSPIVRKNVSVAQLRRALTPGRIAIVPLQLRHDQNHYFIAMLDRNGKPLLVNVLFGHGPLADALSDEELRATSGIVMFVEAPQTKAKASSMSEFVQVSPSTIDLGQVSMTGTAPIEIASAFTVTNTGDRAVCVVEMQKSCGCTQPDWGGGVLRAGEVVHVAFTVYSQAWGRGPQRKPMYLTFADGSKQTIDIVGEGIGPAEIQGLRLSRNQLDIDVTALLKRQALEVASSDWTVKCSGIHPDSVRAETSHSWLKLDKQVLDDESIRCSLRIVGNDGLQDTMSGSDSHANAEVRFWAANDESPVILSLRLKRDRFFRFEQPRMAFSTDGPPASVRCRVLPIENSETIRVASAESVPSGLEIDVGTQGNGETPYVEILGLTSPDNLRRHYVIRCRVESSTGETATASIPVLLSAR